jgi:hypothetical protein
LPWLKFSRTTLTPARIICSSRPGSLDAGPRVATILVARQVMGRLGSGGENGGLILPAPGDGAVTGHRDVMIFIAVRACLSSAGGPFFENLEGRQLLAFQHLQEGAAAGGDVADVLVDAVLGDGRQRIATSGDAEERALSAMALAMVRVPFSNGAESRTRPPGRSRRWCRRP